MQSMRKFCDKTTVQTNTWLSFFFSSIAFIKMIIYGTGRLIKSLTILAHHVVIYVCAQQCDRAYNCYYADTEGVSPLNHEFQRAGHHSCLWHCTQDPNCKAVTQDLTRDTCQLHFEANNIACLQMLLSPGKSLWVVTEYENYFSGCKVLCMKHFVHTLSTLNEWGKR